MDTNNLRVLDVDDIEKMVDLTKACLVYCHEEAYNELDIKRDLLQLLDMKQCVIYGAFDEENLVGIIIGFFVKKTFTNKPMCEIPLYYFLKGFKDLGLKLLSVLLKFCDTRDVECVRIYHTLKMIKAKELYETFDFKHTVNCYERKG